jgi:sn-glycerol 3-phosphate transport system permease protein
MSRTIFKGWMGLVLILPQLLLVTGFYFVPIFKVCHDAFYYIDPFGMHVHFAGIQNFIDVFHDEKYIQAIQITLFLAVGIVLVTTGMGLSIALGLQGIARGRTFYKMMLLWPYAVSPAIAAILWRFLLHPTTGWLSEFLSYFHMEFNYLVHPGKALFAVMLIAVWQQLSYNILFFFVALEALPHSLTEAAKLDGANAWHRFWQIRFPMIKSIVGFLCLINALYACFDTFSVIDILTAGGPGNQTTTLLYKIYKDGFLGMDWSSAAAQSVLLMAGVVLFSLLQQGYVNRSMAVKS